MRVFLVLTALAWTLAAARPAHSETVETSLCVYGGTGAGIAAAVQAARMDCPVALIVPYGHAGGILVNGLGGTDVNNHGDFQNDSAVGGIALEFYRRIGKHYGIADWDARRGEAAVWRFEPHVAERIFNEWLSEHEIPVYYNARLREDAGAVERDGARIVAVRMENGLEIRAEMFIDATLEGDLLHRAGVSTIIGREANRVYGETKNGIRGKNTYRQFEVCVDPYIVPGDPSSGLIPTIRDEPLGTPGEGDRRIQAYCFRMCLTKRPANRIPFSPPDYDPGAYEIYRRYIEAGGNLYRPRANLPNGKTDLGAWHDLSHNLYGMNHGYPGGDYATRGRVFQEHKHFTQGLFYFLANDPYMPAAVRDEWSAWGLCKDEFADNGGWPRQFYVRDARRMVSDYVITEHHTRRDHPERVADPVGVAYWPPDVHHVRRIVRDGAAYNEGFVFGGNDWRPFGVPYRALVPRGEEAINLLTPTCVSSSHIAHGAIRIEWTYMVLGQSAATAAALAVRDGVSVQAVDYGELRARLLADGQVLDAPPPPSLR